MNASTAAAALAALADDAPAWLPPVDHWEIAREGEHWIVSGQLCTEGGTLGEGSAYRLLGPIVEQSGRQLVDDGRQITAVFEHFGVPVSVWYLRPVLRWLVPEQCATCPTKLGSPEVAFVRLGAGDREAPVICVPCRDRMHASWVLVHGSPLVAARDAARALLLTQYSDARPHWRQVFDHYRTGDYDAIAPVCPHNEHEASDSSVHSCCPGPVIALDDPALGAYLAELLNVDVEAGEPA
ncbi:hypothetical protein GTW29_09275 [Streptomyces sp. SID7834]|nr:hypothetical protein [Streptomyces sp. SID7834]MYT56914.1 hypothetical protein [Streptomyces sp. SID7834]